MKKVGSTVQRKQQIIFNTLFKEQYTSTSAFCLYTAQASSHNGIAWAVVPTRTQWGLGTSHTSLNCFAYYDIFLHRNQYIVQVLTFADLLSSPQLGLAARDIFYNVIILYVLFKLCFNVFYFCNKELKRQLNPQEVLARVRAHYPLPKRQQVKSFGNHDNNIQFVNITCHK